MPHMRPVSLMIVVAALAASGCIQVELPGASGVNPTPPRPAPGDRPTPPDRHQPPLGRKKVTAKEPPTTLFAKDGSWCTVSDERYQMIKIGDNAWCPWTGG